MSEENISKIIYSATFVYIYYPTNKTWQTFKN